MDEIVIKGGDILNANEINTVYEVLSGEVLVFVVPIKDGEPGRRLLLGTFVQGNKIPGFEHSSKMYGCWRLILSAVDRAEISKREAAGNEKIIFDFAKQTGLPQMDRKESEPLSETGIRDEVRARFEESVIERYNRHGIKQDGYIYANIREKEYTKERTLRTIFNAFIKNRSERKISIQETGNALYDAAALVCRIGDMDIAPYDRIEESAGHRFDIDDIARLSHFVIREVTLEKNWYRSDCGVFLAYYGTKKQPVAVIPGGPYSYYMYDPRTKEEKLITKKTASDILPSAYMFYRPFPDKAIGFKDLLAFGMKKVYISDLVRMGIMALFGVLIGMLIPYMNEQLYDSLIPMGDKPEMVRIGILLLSCAIGGISFTIVKNLAVFRSMNTMEYGIQSAVFDRLFRLPESFYRDYDAASLGVKAMKITNIFAYAASGTATVLLSFIFSFLYLFQMFKFSKDLAGAALALTVVMLVITVLIGICQTGYEKKIVSTDTESQSMMFQTIKGLTKLRMAGAEERALQRYIGKLVDSQQAGEAKENLTNIVSVLTGGMEILSAVVFFLLMTRVNFSLSIGAFSAFMAAFGAFCAAVSAFGRELLNVNDIRPAYEDVRPILETLPETREDAGMPGDIGGEIEISSVTFGYDTEQEPVLKDFSLHVSPDEYVGIVGSSGCGKSTLLKLLLGFEKPQIGKIYYDDQDIDGLDKRELRKKFGVVLQDGGLISGSIYDNIAITAPGVKMERIRETIKDVGLEEDITNMPMGLHTLVSEESETISGGQRQRILIARAIVGKPKIVFLDEATSALDNTSQAQIVNTLEKLDSTKIVIAHRLSTVVNCDRIIVMEKGRIKETGNYRELMKQKGLFYELAIRQIS
ncbi:MAG: NHLP bacteriocin export ABC transporter permease/ATPase subunit [Lachnospiraceae bacterium]|nr:NHLP bacteriocin export ABC transporter permease/ATPase subunit [Lachnospiraceae bacterium]